MSKKKDTKAKVSRDRAGDVAEQLKGMTLLGEIITWNARTEATHKHQDVLDALTAADLDVKVARELLPRHAFARACKTLAEERVINVIRDGADSVRFQFTAMKLAKDEWKFSTEAKLDLNKITGDITCDSKELAELAQREVDRCMEERTTSDITKIVQRLFEKNADLFSVRDQGGVYFVPSEHTGFISKVELFLAKLGGSIRRFPVPAGTQFGDKAVQESVADAMAAVIRDHDLSISQFTINTRKDTLEHAASKINATRVKVEAYAHYLAEQRQGLLEALDKSDTALKEQIEKLATQKAAIPEGQGRVQLFGQPMTAVIRWMGKNGWTFDEAGKALVRMNVSVASATIRAQLLAGARGERGDPAVITKAQEKELRDTLKDDWTPPAPSTPEASNGAVHTEEAATI